MVNVALLGAGFMAATRVPGYLALADRARVTCVCARTVAGLRVAERLGARVEASLGAVLADPAVDAVDVCLPTPLHRPVAERALRAGKHVLVEKPIALKLEDAEALAASARETGRLLMVGHVLRFSDGYVQIERLVQGRTLGAPLGASALRLSPLPDWNAWMRDPAQSGGTLVDLLVHDFDQLNALLGPPRRVHATALGGGPAGGVAACVAYERAQALVEGSIAMPPSRPFEAGLRVVCERGVVEHGFRAAPAADGGNIGGETDAWLRVHPADGPARELPLADEDPWAAEVCEFVDCVESGRAISRGTPAQAIDALGVALAGARSLALGEPVDLPLPMAGAAA
jgi:predicted dehydrogenase